MPVLIDTDIAIHLRDGTPAIVTLLDSLGETPSISAVTLVELQAGVAMDQSRGRIRERLLAEMLGFVAVLPFTEQEAAAYGIIIQSVGFDRRRVLDRMIAAQAVVAGARLITVNGRDFTDIPGLELEVWPAP